MLRAGKAVGHLLGRTPFGKAGVTALVGGSAAAGVVSGVLDRQGPYPSIAQDVLGDHRAFNASAKAAVLGAFSSNTVSGTTDYYYGRSANPKRQRVAPSGDVVFGMYNLRR